MSFQKWELCPGSPASYIYDNNLTSDFNLSQEIEIHSHCMLPESILSMHSTS